MAARKKSHKRLGEVGKWRRSEEPKSEKRSERVRERRYRRREVPTLGVRGGMFMCAARLVNQAIHCSGGHDFCREETERCKQQGGTPFFSRLILLPTIMMSLSASTSPSFSSELSFTALTGCCHTSSLLRMQEYPSTPASQIQSHSYPVLPTCPLVDTPQLGNLGHPTVSTSALAYNALIDGRSRASENTSDSFVDESPRSSMDGTGSRRPSSAASSNAPPVPIRRSLDWAAQPAVRLIV